MAKKVGITSVGFPEFDKAVIEFERRYINEVKRIIVETAEMIVTQAKALAPVSGPDGGNLRRSIEVFYHNKGLTAEIIVGAHYGIFVEFGTSPHIIRPKKKKALFWIGAKYPVKVVHHPGTTAQPFFRPAIEQGARHFERELDKLG